MTSRGFLTRSDDGGVTATLRDRWGHVFTLTGAAADHDGVKGYDIEVKLTGVPAELAVPGDEENFEVIG